MRNNHGAVLEFTIDGLKLLKVDQQLLRACRRFRTEDDMFAIVDEATGEVLVMENTSAKADRYFWKEAPIEDLISELNTGCSMHLGLTLDDIINAVKSNKQLDKFVQVAFMKDYVKQLKLHYGEAKLELSACFHFKKKHVDFIHTCSTTGPAPISLDKEVVLVGVRNNPRRGYRFTLLDVLQSLFSFAKEYRVNTLNKDGLLTPDKKPKTPMSALLDMCMPDLTLGELFQFVDKHPDLKQFIKSYTWSPDIDEFHAEALKPKVAGRRDYHLMEVTRGSYIGENHIEVHHYFHVLGKKPNMNELQRFDFYDIDMNAVADLPVLTNPQTIFQDNKAIRKFQSEFTLLEILRTVYWEVTRHGSPAFKQAYKVDLVESAAKVMDDSVSHVVWANSR